MSDYGSPVKTEPAPAPAPKKKREGKKLTDKQKGDLNKHMEKVGKNMTASEKKSHRMRLMSKMRNQGLTVNKAHKLITQ